MRTELVNTILTKPSENIIITDSSKFGQKQPYQLSTLESIHRVITDQAIRIEDEQYLTAKKIIVDKVV